MDVKIIFKNSHDLKKYTRVYDIEYLRSNLFNQEIKLLQIYYVIPERLKDGELYDAEPKKVTYKLDNIEVLEVN